MYRRVNALFGDAVLEEADGRPAFVFIQDYHFALVAALSQGAQSQPDRRPVLAHPLAEPRDLSRLPLERRAARRPAGQRPLGLSSAVSLPELHGNGRPHHRGPDRPRTGRDRPQEQADPGAAVPDQHRFRPPGGAGRQHRGRAGNQASCDRDASPPRRDPGHRHRTDRLHQGNSRSACEALDRFFERFPEYRERSDVHPGRRSQPRSYSVSTSSSTRRSIAWSSEINWKWGTSRWRPVDVFQAALLHGRDDGLAPAGRFLHRQLAARRDEPGGQGVRRQPV